ncbi:EG45-like domain containing protein 2 [Hibiscus syriacus]|uniref:EG45-like domain containing protein 2 n=1 Tax=Hibiscus syriacus TaxID=106335 RepID=A0A6A3B3U9_HIBSY|nr:EG45-like domain containing protein 2 [Hibiscus syriacus]
MVLCLSSIVHAIQGKAVFYGPPYLPSASYGNQKNGIMVAGVSDALWQRGRACGKRYRVKCIGGANQVLHPCKNGKTVVVKVVDYCKARCQGIINLSRDAFSTIADPNAGIVLVELNEYAPTTLYSTSCHTSFRYHVQR